MPYTLPQLDFLQAHVGVAIAPAFLENKRRAEEFKQRREKVAADSSGKPAEWSFRSRFDGLLRGAADNAGKQKFDIALQLIGQAEELLQQPEPPPQPPSPKTEASDTEVSAEDMAVLFEEDPAVILRREWARVKAAMLPTLQAAAEKETPVKATLTRILLDLVNLEKSGNLQEALAVIERARAPLKTALETEPGATGDADSGAARMEFLVARNRAINDVTDAKASKGFGKAHTGAVTAIQDLEDAVKVSEAAKKWTEGMAAVAKLQEHARMVLDLSARTVKAEADFRALDKTVMPKFKEMRALRGKKGKGVDALIASALKTEPSLIDSAVKAADFEEALKHLGILETAIDQALAAGRQQALDQAAYAKRWNAVVLPKAAAAAALVAPPASIPALITTQNEHNRLVQAKVADGDFAGALSMLDRLVELAQGVLDARAAWERERTAFNDALAAAKDAVEKAQTTGSLTPAVGALRDAYATERKKMDDLVTASNFAAALPQLSDKVLPAATALIDGRAAHDLAKQNYTSKKAPLIARLAEAAGFTPSTPELVSLKEAHDKEVKALAPLEAARNYTAATASLDGAVTTTLNALLAKKTEHDRAKTAEVDSRKDAAGKAAKAMLGDVKNLAMVDPAAAVGRVETAVKKSKDLAGDAELKKLREEAARISGMSADALKDLSQGGLLTLEALDNALAKAIANCDTYQKAHKATSKSKSDQVKFRLAETLRTSHEVLRLRLKTILSSFSSIEAKATQPDDLSKAEAAHLYGLLAKNGSTPEIKAGAAARQRAILTKLLKDAKDPDRVREIAEIVGDPALSQYKAQAGKPSLADLHGNGNAAAEQKKSKLQNPDRAANVDLAKNLSDRLITDDGLDVMALHLQKLDDLDDGTPAGKAMARTLKQLRDDPKLQALFDGLPTPKRDNPICDMLRATLGKKGDAELTPQEVKKAVLSAMLAELRQMDVGSCFGTSVAVHVHDSKPELMLKDMHQMLGTGAITRMAGGKLVEAPVQPRMSDAPMNTPLKLGKADGKLKAANGANLDAAQSLESTPAFSSALDSLGIAGPKRKAALQTAQTDLANQQALKAAMAKLPASVDEATRERLRLAVLDKLAASPNAKVKVELAKEVQKLKPPIPSAERKDIASSAQGVLDAPEQEASAGDLLRQVAMRENGISEADLARLEKMKEMRPKILALQGDTTSPAALKVLDEYDALQKKIGAKTPKMAQFMKDLANAQDGYLSKEDNRLLRCWEYTVSALAEQGISRKNTEQLNKGTKEAMTDEFNAALGELDQDADFKKSSKKMDVVAIATKLRARYEELMPDVLQTGYDASVKAAVSSDGSSSRGAFYLFDTQGIKDPTQWIKIDDQSKYVTVVRGLVMLAWNQLYEREKDKKVKEVSRKIADQLVDRLGKESFANAAATKVKTATGSDAQKPWQKISGSHQDFMTQAYFGVENPARSSTQPSNPEDLANFVVETTSGMWDKVKDGVAANPEGTSVPMGNGPHAFNLKPGSEKLQKLAAQPGATGQQKVASFKAAEQTDNRARLDTPASPQVLAALKNKFLGKWGKAWDALVQAELDKLATPTVKQASDAMEKAIMDNFMIGLPAKVTDLEQKALAKSEPFDAAATRQKLIDDRKALVRKDLAPAIAETVVPPVKKADQGKLLDKAIRKTGIDPDLVDAVRERALKTLGDNASMSDVEAAVRKALEQEGVKTDAATSQSILDGMSQAQGPAGLVFADSNWGSGAHRTMFSMVVNPLSNEVEMWQMNEDGSGMRPMDPKTWVECPWDIKTEPKEFGGV